MTDSIGVSGHIQTYGPGVLVQNWGEDRVGQEFEATGRHVLGFGAPFLGTTVQQSSYRAVDPAELGPREKAEGSQGVGADVLTRHGDFLGPRDTFFATLNQLSYGLPLEHGRPKVGAATWTGQNIHDVTVPLNTATLEQTSRRAVALEQEASQSPYQTSARAGQLGAALQAAAHPTKQGTVKLQTDGQAGTVGRKPTGPHADEVAKTYRRTGLRNNYYTGNMC